MPSPTSPGSRLGTHLHCWDMAQSSSWPSARDLGPDLMELNYASSKDELGRRQLGRHLSAASGDPGQRTQPHHARLLSCRTLS